MHFFAPLWHGPVCYACADNVAVAVNRRFHDRRTPPSADFEIVNNFFLASGIFVATMPTVRLS
jgi:hypothetical protein